MLITPNSFSSEFFFLVVTYFFSIKRLFSLNRSASIYFYNCAMLLLLNYSVIILSPFRNKVRWDGIESVSTINALCYQQRLTPSVFSEPILKRLIHLAGKYNLKIIL